MTEQEAISILEAAGFDRGGLERAAPDLNPIIRAGDLAHALTALLIELLIELARARGESEILMDLPKGLEFQAAHVRNTPAGAALEMIAASLRASEPESERKANHRKEKAATKRTRQACAVPTPADSAK